MKETTAYARQLYLYGEGTDPPIKDIKKLSERSGCPERTLRDWIKEWRLESERLALSHKDSPFSIELSSEVLAQHRKEIDFLAAQVRKLRIRLSKTKTTSPSYPVYLSSYQSALTKWEKSSGIMAQYDVALAAMKESARAGARAAAKAGQTDSPRIAKGVDRSRFDTGA